MTSTKEYVQRDDATRRGTNRKRGKRRCRKRLSTLLHTHVALIIVCTIAALDAACVIGQIICDILIMKETLHEWEVLDGNLTTLLWQELPLLNATGHSDVSSLDLRDIRDTLLEHRYPQHSDHSAGAGGGGGGGGGTNMTDAITSQLAASGLVVPAGGLSQQWLQALQSAAASLNLTGTQSTGTLNLSVPAGGTAGGTNGSSAATPGEVIIGFFKIPVSSSRRRRRRSLGGGGGGEGGDEPHGLLNDLTHSFHLGSMILLSLLLLETLLKVFAMGKKILHHKLEVFDAFVVSVSWALDVAFYQGIWAHPGTEAATILIFILPWRVVRIVNSFVLVIQEKDQVQLKIVKQRLRMSVKKNKESTRKAASYRTEVKQLQGLCRKYGATENEITACGPTGRTGRRRSSLLPAMERAASLTLISALGSHPSLYTMDSSSDEEDVRSRDLSRSVSQDPTLRSTLSINTLDSIFTTGGKSTTADDDFTSDNDLDHDLSAEGLDNPIFIDCQDHSPAVPRTGAGEGEGGGPGEEHVEVCPVDVESGHTQLAEDLHQKLSEQPSVVSTVSTVSETSSHSEDSGGSGADPTAQDIPPRYHEAVSKQNSDTRL
ncbi:uncharacterized protein LOC143286695 [Babylonia areolata]|uniref:uncharacterized protein LOC143286695 n=1 Tax=Babylonia areolata TaxID=304850 RepID=UPI003FD096D3